MMFASKVSLCSVATSAIKSCQSRVSVRPALAVQGKARRAAGGMMATSAAVKYESNVIGDPARRVQGNCVTCMGTLLYLREKRVDVTVANYVDESMEEPWIKQVCPGEIKMPMLHVLPEDRWLCGSEAIWGYMEEHHREAREMGRPPAELPGGVLLGRVAPGMYKDRLFTLLRTTLTSSDAAEASRAMGDLEALLRQLDGWLAEKGRPFIGGEEPNTTDCYLVPKLQHAVLALKDNQRCELPGDMQALRRYLEAWKVRPSWQQSHYDEGLTLAFWQRKVAKAHGAASSKPHL